MPSLKSTSPAQVGRKRKLTRAPSFRVARRLRMEPSRNNIEYYLITQFCKGIEDIIQQNKNSTQTCKKFDSAKADSTADSLVDFVSKIVSFLNRWDVARIGINHHRNVIGANEFSLGINTILIALIYLVRLNREKLVLITGESVRTLLLCAVTVSHKFCEERSMGCKSFSRFSCREKKEFAKLETSFCQLLGWKLSVTGESFQAARARCIETVSCCFRRKSL